MLTFGETFKMLTDPTLEFVGYILIPKNVSPKVNIWKC
jgi:hypothetical protein